MHGNIKSVCCAVLFLTSFGLVFAPLTSVLCLALVSFSYSGEVYRISVCEIEPIVGGYIHREELQFNSAIG